MLTKEEKEQIRNSIHDKIEMKNKNIAELEVFLNTNFTEGVSNADNFKKATITSAVRIMKGELVKLIHAQSMVDKPSYGRCPRCGNLLPFNQLINNPEKSNCEKCS